MIHIIDRNTFSVKVDNTTYTLKPECCNDRTIWRQLGHTVHATKEEHLSISVFASLKEVEAHQTHWQGIAKLHQIHGNSIPFSNGANIQRSPLKTTLKLPIKLKEDEKDLLQHIINSFSWIVPLGKTFSLVDFANEIRKLSDEPRSELLANALCLWESKSTTPYSPGITK
ncbi:hypothetical protein L1D14_07675 [Vibrio tubiashii]|uniref:hypothetical protein n=1 Tax=Vibrio tubiashii TaxID=29498 RepID=UPI001EFEB388|nr:hypothetical protein [Vibrio tubiashii]MCG9576118.1 hypothetical protein [Vibrio tubiashii]